MRSANTGRSVFYAGNTIIREFCVADDGKIAAPQHFSKALYCIPVMHFPHG